MSTSKKVITLCSAILISLAVSCSKDKDNNGGNKTVNNNPVQPPALQSCYQQDQGMCTEYIAAAFKEDELSVIGSSCQEDAGVFAKKGCPTANKIKGSCLVANEETKKTIINIHFYTTMFDASIVQSMCENMPIAMEDGKSYKTQWNQGFRVDTQNMQPLTMDQLSQMKENFTLSN